MNDEVSVFVFVCIIFLLILPLYLYRSVTRVVENLPYSVPQTPSIVPEARFDKISNPFDILDVEIEEAGCFLRTQATVAGECDVFVDVPVQRYFQLLDWLKDRVAAGDSEACCGRRVCDAFPDVTPLGGGDDPPAPRSVPVGAGRVALPVAEYHSTQPARRHRASHYPLVALLHPHWTTRHDSAMPISALDSSALSVSGARSAQPSSTQEFSTQPTLTPPLVQASYSTSHPTQPSSTPPAVTQSVSAAESVQTPSAGYSTQEEARTVHSAQPASDNNCTCRSASTADSNQPDYTASASTNHCAQPLCTAQSGCAENAPVESGVAVLCAIHVDADNVVDAGNTTVGAVRVLHQYLVTSAPRVIAVRRAYASSAADRACVVCLTRRVDRLLSPCHHACVCGDCLPLLRECPVCRALVDSAICLDAAHS